VFVMSTGTGVSVLAHGIHYAVLAAGLVGLLVLLVPQLLESRRLGTDDWLEQEPRDEHEARVRALRAELAQFVGSTTVLTEPPPATDRRERRGVERPTLEASVLLPLAVVGSAAAAIVHGAVCPDHFHEKFVLGLFFAVCAVAQVSWAFLVARGPTTPLLVAGAVGNFLMVALWTVTRVEGLPFGLLPRAEEVGRWDLAAGTWELVVVVTCVLLVRRGRRVRMRLAPFAQWHLAVQALTLVSAASLVALSLSGVSS
jgi:hypothetical protein